MRGDGAVHRPVFVIGTGRCGLSPVVDLLSAHPQTAWPTQYHKVFPGHPRVAMAARVATQPWAARVRMRRAMPRHDEAYPFWTSIFRGFSEPDRDLTADDLTPYIGDRIRQAVADLVRYQGGSRFMAEYSGWSRIRFFKAVFPDALFIHVVRDGRAVAHSLLHVDYWRGYDGFHRWQFGLPSQQDVADLERYGDSFLARAALNWRRLIDNLVEVGDTLDASEIRTIRYEDFVKQPETVAVQALEFAGFDTADGRLHEAMRRVRIVDANSTALRIPSWRENLRADQVEMLNDLLGPQLDRFGYPKPSGAQAATA